MDTTGRPLPYRASLLALAAAALALRAFLIFRGGQNYWPDEIRYQRSREAAAAISRGDRAAARLALTHGDHLLFGVLGIVPASLEPLTGDDPRVPALFFALFSVASLAALAGVTRRLGESEAVALLSAALFALSTTQLYDARHLLPYDASMALGLAALHAGLATSRPARASAACGVLAAAAFLTYNGYWLLAAVAMLVTVLRPPRSPAACLRRAVVTGGAFAATTAAIAVVVSGGVRAYAGAASAFARTATQGDFGEGWSLPFAYLWHAEHGLALLWALCLLRAIVRLARGDRNEALGAGVAGTVAIYAGLVVASVVLHRLVVYGRQVRQLVPFLCLISAVALDRTFSAAPRRRLAYVAGAVLLAQAVANFATPLRQVFPAEFRRMAARIPVHGSPRLEFVGHIYPVPFVPPPVAGTVLLERPHPLEYLPYQYEGYTPRQRAALRMTDIHMRLVDASP